MNESQPSKRPRVIAAVVAAMVIVAVIAIVLNSRSGDKSGPGQDDQANAAAQRVARSHLAQRTVPAPAMDLTRQMHRVPKGPPILREPRRRR